MKTSNTTESPWITHFQAKSKPTTDNKMVGLHVADKHMLGAPIFLRYPLAKSVPCDVISRLNRQICTASCLTMMVNHLDPLQSFETNIKRPEWRAVSKEHNLYFHFCCPILKFKRSQISWLALSSILCCLQSRRHCKYVWVMSMTQHKRSVASLAPRWKRHSHFNQGYWGGVCLGRQAWGF